MARGTPSWQLILADLALILFLVTLSALAKETADEGGTSSAGKLSKEHRDHSHIAQSQSLFRPDPLGPTVEEWLNEQPTDPRATLTIFAKHTGDDASAVWERAQAMSQAIAASSDKGISVRVVITQGRQSDIYASLAYDEPSATTGSQR